MACSADETIDVVVIDSGSRMIRAGIAGDQTPRVVLPTAYTQQRLGFLPSGNNGCERRLFGDEAIADTRTYYTFHSPMQDRIVEDWHHMDRIWCYIFQSLLRIEINEHPILVTKPPLLSKSYREKLTEFLFESINAPALYLANRAVLSLYASGKLTGMVYDSGHHVSYTVPVYEGYSIPHTLQPPFALGGDAVTESLMKSLGERGYTLPTRLDRDSVRRMKEEFCYVALNYEDERAATKHSYSLEKEFTLPDGRVIEIGEERFRCPEILFQSQVDASERPCFVEKLNETIQNCDIDIQNQLYHNILLSGGSTLFSGFLDRTKKDLKALVNPSMETRVIAPAEPQFAPWIGGSMLGSLSTFETMWISASEYNDYGPSIVHLKCF